MRKQPTFALTATTVVALAMSAIAFGQAQQIKILATFNANGTISGNLPVAPLLLDSAGNLYGTTLNGGTNPCQFGCGTVFELSLQASGSWQRTEIYNFKNSGQDGHFPFGGLISDAAGNLYGTTQQGGPYMCDSGDFACGTVFELSPQAGGGWTEKVLHDFQDNGTDGWDPWAGLILDKAGNLYGTTLTGGISEAGTIFELSPAADGTWTEKILYTFTGNADGAAPYANLVFDAAGNLYGTTEEGGAYTGGTVFELTPGANGTWTESVLYSFAPYWYGGSDGYYPLCALVLDPSGNLYGTTYNGGIKVNTEQFGGTVFELTKSSSGTWKKTQIHVFSDMAAGYNPVGGLVFDPAGNLYGTTQGGGTSNKGTVFEMSPKTGGSWTFQTLHNFANHPDGETPSYGQLTIDPSGNLYGAAPSGGPFGGGTVFEIEQ